jgi:ribose transport system substrate-binding protein
LSAAGDIILSIRNQSVLPLAGRSRIFIAALAWFVLLSPGCRGPGDGRTASVRPLRIAVIPMGTTHEFWKSVHAGALTAARELDVEITWKGPLKEDDRNEQIQVVETLTEAGVDALVLSPLDDRALLRPVAEARRAGIPTVIFNSALQGEEHVAFISTDNFQGGVMAARALGRGTGGRGRLVLIRLKVGVEGTTKREEGFLATLRAEYPRITVLSDNQYAGTSTEMAYQTMENLLSRFAEVEAVFTPNESTTFGALRALQDHGLAGKVVHVGFDASEKLIEALEKHELAGLILQDPFAMGYLSVKTAVAHLRGEPYAKNVATTVVLATPENMNEPDVQRLLRPDLSILKN